MKIVIPDGRALNPGDLSYEPLRQFGELTVYNRTDTVEEAIARIGHSEIVDHNNPDFVKMLHQLKVHD